MKCLMNKKFLSFAVLLRTIALNIPHNPASPEALPRTIDNTHNSNIFMVTIPRQYKIYSKKHVYNLVCVCCVVYVHYKSSISIVYIIITCIIAKWFDTYLPNK